MSLSSFYIEWNHTRISKLMVLLPMTKVNILRDDRSYLIVYLFEKPTSVFLSVKIIQRVKCHITISTSSEWLEMVWRLLYRIGTILLLFCHSLPLFTSSICFASTFYLFLGTRKTHQQTIKWSFSFDSWEDKKNGSSGCVCKHITPFNGPIVLFFIC